MKNTAYFRRTIIVVLTCAVQIASAATTDTPKARAEIETYGNTYSGKQIGGLRAIYKEHLAEAGNETADVVRDISYGPHERHRLDILRPRNPVSDAMPVLVFIHGGAFVRGNKSDGIIFDNVLNYFVSRGVLGINATYRLAPEHPWPAGADDIREVVRWIRENASEHGGDPNRIFLMGHSAGAAHVATYAFMEKLQLNGGEDGVVGAILLSGTFGEGSEASMRAYYGEDRALWAERLPINNIEGRKIPLFVINAEYDRTSMAQESITLIQAICERDDRCPDHKQIPGHNHYSMMYHFNTADDSIAADILEFIRR
ncbi:MAG: alpha/beta hydrolase [Proteobacteria bacterium]|nr:alpha/beta hydrolase [Pseudomonadota bacterium]